MYDNTGIFLHIFTSQDEGYYFKYVLVALEREVFVVVFRMCNRSNSGVDIILLDLSLVFAEILGMRDAKRTQTKTRWFHHKGLITLRALKRAS